MGAKVILSFESSREEACLSVGGGAGSSIVTHPWGGPDLQVVVLEEVASLASHPYQSGFMTSWETRQHTQAPSNLPSNKQITYTMILTKAQHLTLRHLILDIIISPVFINQYNSHLIIFISLILYSQYVSLCIFSFKS